MDEGYGISESNLKNIFDPYFTTKKVGTGLGLATTYSIIISHGGKISVQSTLGKGATFTILLPATEQNCAEAGQTDDSVTLLRSTGSILVMDDEEMIRDLATLSLGRQGYMVVTCSNGKEAIAHYKAALEAGAPFSVVIMDLTIPGGMGGVETAKLILEMDAHAHLVVSSGYSAAPVMANYKEYGFCAAIEKPYNVQEVAKIIGSCNKYNS
jgi:CheY-like chemotaxis protein